MAKNGCVYKGRRQKSLFVATYSDHTFFRDDVQGDSESSVFDQLDNISVRHVDDRLTVDSHNTITNLQLPTAISRTALDDTADLMWHSYKTYECKYCENFMSNILVIL